MNAAEYLVEQLRAWGVERVYGLPGDAVLEFIDALGRFGRPQFIPVRHEAAAAFMASAEAKLTGRPACCVATAGPGAANLLSGLADADADRAPVLAITGQVPRRAIGTEERQAVDQQRLFSPVSGFTALVAAPEALPQVLPLAWRAMQAGGRAAHLSIPADVWAGAVEAPVRRPEPFLGAGPSVSPAMIAEAAAILDRAQRPVVLVGHGARAAREAVMRLAERWQAAIVRSMGGIGVVPGSHPLAVGGVGEGGSGAAHAILRRADVVLAVGTTWWPAAYVPAGLTVVQVDRVPANIGRDYEVAYGLPGDSAGIVPALVEAIRAAERPGWLGEVEGLRRRWQGYLDELARPTGPPLSPGHLVAELERAAPADAVAVVDVGDHVLWFNQFFRGDAHHVLVSGTWRSMGFAVPAAVAAKLAAPFRAVFALVGDGGMGMLAGELLTAARLGAPVTIVVANNGALAMERNKMALAHLSSYGTDLFNPDFVGLARACGVAAWRVDGPAALPGVLREALASGRPALVDVPVTAGPPPRPELL